MEQRQIKFRAWDKDKKRMYSWEDYKLDVLALVIQPSQEYPIMQFTGLLDKNGKEIYEGDISWDSEYEEYGKIYFDDGCFCYEHDNVIEQLGEWHDSIEVIGNIYQNPDLLK